MPARFRTAQFTDFSATIATTVQAWIEKPGDGLFISGATGTGKTHLGCALLMEWVLLRRGRARFEAASAVYGSLREHFARGENEGPFLRELIQVPLLMLDDLGAGGLSDFERRTTLEILDGRLNALRPTLVTSNWPLGEIAKRMDDRIASRLAGLQQLELKGKDQRLKRNAPREAGVGMVKSELPINA